MDTKLQSKDYTQILACFIVAIICLVFIISFFYQAFPEASIDFKVNRNQSHVVAKNFLQEIDVDVEDYSHSAIFSYQQDAKTFLEKELGVSVRYDKSLKR